MCSVALTDRKYESGYHQKRYNDFVCRKCFFPTKFVTNILCVFFVLCGSNFDLIFALIYDIIAEMAVGGIFVSFWVIFV